MSDDSSSRKPATGADALFRNAVADVQPLPQRRVRPHGGARPRADLQARRDAAEGQSERQEGGHGLSAVAVEAVSANAVLAWKSTGVQERVFRRLKTGRFEILRTLDLHGLTVRQAEEAVLRLVEGTRADHPYCVLIIHGRGTDSREPARLKSCVYAWLRQHPRAVALHSATRHDGGTGATYALLKRRPSTDAG